MTDEAVAVEVEEVPVEAPVDAAPAVAAVPELTAHQKFLEMLPEDLRTDPSFMDFKGEDINEVIGKLGKSYVNTKKLVGADKNAVLKIPASEDDKDGWNAVYTKLGRPEKPDDYGIVEKYKDTPGVNVDGMKEIMQAAFDHGASTKVVNAIVGKYFEQNAAMAETSKEDVTKMQEGYVDALKKEWGGAYEQNTNKVLNELKKSADPEFLELAAAYPHIFDHPAVMKTLNTFVKMAGEDSGPSKGGTSGDAHMTPAEAQAAINEMDGNAETKKILLNPSDPRRQDILNRRSRLFSYAFPS